MKSSSSQTLARLFRHAAPEALRPLAVQLGLAAFEIASLVEQPVRTSTARPAPWRLQTLGKGKRILTPTDTVALSQPGELDDF